MKIKSIKNFVATTLLVLLIIVVFQNTEPVETRLLFATITMPRALLLFIALSIGVVVGLVLGAKLASSPKPQK